MDQDILKTVNNTILQLKHYNLLNLLALPHDFEIVHCIAPTFIEYIDIFEYI